MDLGENEVWLRYTDFIFARMVRALRQTSENIQKEVTQVVLIVDCAQFTISQLASITSNSRNHTIISSSSIEKYNFSCLCM